MPPRREHGGRVKGVTLEYFRNLYGKIQEMQEQMHKGMNLVVGDYEREDETKEEEENVDPDAIEKVLNLQEAKLFKVISSIGKRTKFGSPTFLGNLNLEELIN